MIKKIRFTIHSQAGTSSGPFLNTHATSSQQFTNIFTRMAIIYPSTMMVEATSPSGTFGKYCSREVSTKQILQINATLERSLNNLIFAQKSVFLGKIPLFCRE